MTAVRPAPRGADASSDGRPDGDQSRRIHPAVEVVLLAALAVAIAFLLKTFVAQAFYIPSGSMEPQLQRGDRVLVSRVSYRIHDPRRGDVVVFDSPYEGDEDDSPAVVRLLRGIIEATGVVQPASEDFIKRVIALPGETVDIRSGRVYVDGREVVEPYLGPTVETQPRPQGVSLPLTVPDGAVFVMGDNRGNSSDSREFGPIAVDSIVGRAVFVVWPPGRAAFL